MKTLLIALLLVSSSAMAQNHNSYESRSNVNRMPDPTSQIMNDDRNYMNNQINQGMRELDVRSNYRRMDLINGGDGYPTGRGSRGDYGYGGYR